MSKQLKRASIYNSVSEKSFVSVKGSFRIVAGGSNVRTNGKL